MDIDTDVDIDIDLGIDIDLDLGLRQIWIDADRFAQIGRYKYRY